MASTSTMSNAEKRKAAMSEEETVQPTKKAKKIKTVAIIESDDEKGTPFQSHTTDGLKTYQRALNNLALKYADKTLTELDRRDIIPYDPCAYSSGDEEPDMSDKEVIQTNDFIDDEAVEKDGADTNEDVEEDNDDENDNDDDDEDDEDDDEEVRDEDHDDDTDKKELPPDCPVCGNAYKSFMCEEKDGTSWQKYWCSCPLPWWGKHNQLESHMIVVSTLLKKFKAPEGKIPNCKRHGYPGRLYIYNAYQKSADKAAKDPMHKQKMLLDKRLFFICVALQEITDEYKPKGKCDWVLSADCIGLEATKLQELYTEIIVETRNAKKAGNRGFNWQFEQEMAKFKAQMKARKTRMKRELEKIEKKDTKKKNTKKVVA